MPFPAPISRIAVTARHCFLALALAGCAARAPAPAPAPAVAAPRITDVRYELAFDSATARERTVRVAMSFVAEGSGTVVLSLPAWTPGAYEIANFARWVSRFSASSAGQPVHWDKADHDSWRVRVTSGQPIVVTFDYRADTLDNAMAWSADDFLMVNGTTVFLYPEDQALEFESRVRVTTQAGWRVATSMTRAGAPDEYTAASYHELVDMPLFIGHFDLDSSRVGEAWVRMATYPADAISSADRMFALAQVGRMLPPQQAVFGTTPFDRYTILQIFDTTQSGISALEHRNSFVAIAPPEAAGTPSLYSIYAHELFHVWNVKRMRPSDLRPYRYDLPQPTEWLWVSEGITDYYADLSLVRGGIIDSAEVLAVTAAKIAEVDSLPPVSLEDASLSTWLAPVDGTHYLYYTKGSLAGLILDILIRDASDNRGSLDVAMRDLHDVASREARGFTGADWWGAVSRAAGGRSFTEFRDRYVDGRDPFPWNATLELAGLRLVADTVHEPVVGILVMQDTAGLMVAELQPGTAAARAGVRVGDYLVSLGDIPVDAPDFPQRMRAMYGDAQRPVLPLGLRRGRRAIAIDVPVTYVAVIERSLVADSNAPEKAHRIRSSILRGTLDR